VTTSRRYRYVGPQELGALPAPTNRVAVDSAATVERWLADQEPRERTEPFTYVVDAAGVLRLAPRRSEHVALARGGDVLAAGEILFDRNDGEWCAVDISNQSTGYCPDLGSWGAVRLALNEAGILHPGRFTQPMVFRLCPDCSHINIVRDDDYVCAMCPRELPQEWNFDEVVR
jgi:hypothetical protein